MRKKCDLTWEREWAAVSANMLRRCLTRDHCGDGMVAAMQICALEMEVTMEWNTDFEVSTTVITAIFEVESNVSEFCDPHCELGVGATGITGISAFGYVPAGECRIGLNVADDAGLYNTTRKHITVTGVPNAATGANGIAGYIRLHEGYGWVVFNRTNSTAYPDTGQANVSWTWGINGMPVCSGHGSFSWIIDRDTTETLTVVAGNVCTEVNRAELSCRQPPGGRYTDSDASRHGCTHPVCYVPPAWAGSQKKVGGPEPSL